MVQQAVAILGGGAGEAIMKRSACGKIAHELNVVERIVRDLEKGGGSREMSAVCCDDLTGGNALLIFQHFIFFLLIYSRELLQV